MTAVITHPRPCSESEGHQRQVNEYFADASSYWEDVYQRNDVEGRIYRDRLAAIEALVDRLDLPAQPRTIDIGCGSGLLATHLAQRGFQVEAVDSVPEMVQRAIRNVSASGQDIPVTVGDAANLEFADETFDLVTAVGLLPWAPDPIQVLREIRRTLHPDGFAVITVDNLQRLNFLLDPWLHPWARPIKRCAKRFLSRIGFSLRPEERVIGRFHSPRRGATLLRSAGLSIRSQQSVGFGPFTIFGRQLLSGSPGQRAHALFQAAADGGVPLVNATGSHLIFVCQRNESNDGS